MNKGKALALGLMATLWSAGCQQPPSNNNNHVKVCSENLNTIARALEAYSAAHDHEYPLDLSQLTSQNLVRIPICPSAGLDTYSASYKQSRHAAAKVTNGRTLKKENYRQYLVFCQGQHHRGVLKLPDSPSFDSWQGLSKKGNGLFFEPGEAPDSYLVKYTPDGPGAMPVSAPSASASPSATSP